MVSRVTPTWAWTVIPVRGVVGSKGGRRGSLTRKVWEFMGGVSPTSPRQGWTSGFCPQGRGRPVGSWRKDVFLFPSLQNPLCFPVFPLSCGHTSGRRGQYRDFGRRRRTVVLLSFRTVPTGHTLFLLGPLTVLQCRGHLHPMQTHGRLSLGP